MSPACVSPSSMCQFMLKALRVLICGPLRAVGTCQLLIESPCGALETEEQKRSDNREDMELNFFSFFSTKKGFRNNNDHAPPGICSVYRRTCSGIRKVSDIIFPTSIKVTQNRCKGRVIRGRNTLVVPASAPGIISLNGTSRGGRRGREVMSDWQKE